MEEEAASPSFLDRVVSHDESLNDSEGTLKSKGSRNNPPFQQTAINTASIGTRMSRNVSLHESFIGDVAFGALKADMRPSNLSVERKEAGNLYTHRISSRACASIILCSSTLSGVVGAGFASAPPYPAIAGAALGAAVIIIAFASIWLGLIPNFDEYEPSRPRSGTTSPNRISRDVRLSKIGADVRYTDLRQIKAVDGVIRDDVLSKVSPTMQSIVLDQEIAIGFLQGTLVAITFPRNFRGRFRDDVLMHHRMRIIGETRKWLTALNDNFQGLKKHYGIGCIDDMELHEIPRWMPKSISKYAADSVSDVTDDVDSIFQDQYNCGFAKVSALCVHGTLASFVCADHATDVQNYLMPNVRTRMNFVLDVARTLLRLYKYSSSPKLGDNFFDVNLSTSSIFVNEHFHADIGTYTISSFEAASSPDLNFKSSFFSSPERFHEVIKRVRRGNSHGHSPSSEDDRESAHMQASWRESFMESIGKSWVYSLAMVSFECLTQLPVFSRAIKADIVSGFSHDVATLRVQSHMVEKALRPHIPSEWEEGGEKRFM